MKLEAIQKLIQLGKTKEAIQAIIQIRNKFEPLDQIKVDGIAGRFNSLNNDIHGQLINKEDSTVEEMKIRQSISFLLGKSKNERPLGESDIIQLGQEYIASREIKNNASRLREKNQITTRVSHFFIQNPELIKHFHQTQNQGIISAIAAKIQLSPNIEDLRTLHDLSNKCTSNYAKGHVVNALAAIVYSGQLRMGDDGELREILNSLKPGMDVPLEKNIERVEAALNYV